MRPELLALSLLVSPALAEPRFEPVSLPSHIYGGGWEHFVGGGLAVFDCDGDALPELLAAGGENPATLFRNTSTSQIAFRKNTPQILQTPGMIGAYPLDIDGDGILDLAVLRVGANELLRGGPDCSFVPFEDLGFTSSDKWTTAFSAIWEHGQSLPTLAFGNYVDRTDPDGPFEACDINHLYRPQGTRYAEPVELIPGYCPLSMLFSDWSRTGQADLRISNDRHYYVSEGEEQMWSLAPDLRLLGPQDGWISHKLWGMGIAARDLDRDGLQEVFLTSMGDQRLQKSTGNGAGFEDVRFELGTTAHRPYTGGDGRPSTGWHVAIGDVQNDGRDDVFIAKGNVEQMPDAAMDDPNNLLLQLDDGTFKEAGETAGLVSLHRGRGAALVDLNADGLLDVAVVNRRAQMEVWQNVTETSGNWLAIAVSQPAPNTHGVGAWIELSAPDQPPQLREITVGGGHAGGSAGFHHFGLGQAEQVKIRITWPGGNRSDWIAVNPNRFYTLGRNPSGRISLR